MNCMNISYLNWSVVHTTTVFADFIINYVQAFEKISGFANIFLNSCSIIVGELRPCS